eukprot:TRINITY_DN4720_c0_g3_i4.p2 TRINITY_DN4720_c0_g3~~TRINITY_DN4720_c0_g3_i4.p2  ORF type:complete len:233 (-),score=108.43 TRINITY_DN4720_c0_g3_i4:573-1235(-)
MPKSKRNKIVSLTNTEKKGKPGKTQLIDRIRKCLDDEYQYLYVFAVHNVRTSKFKEVRTEWLGSRFFMGKNKVMQVALGRTPEEEYKPKLHLVSDNVVGICGLFFTNEPEDKVLRFFQEYSEPDFARSGFKATQEVSLPEGPVNQFVGSMEPYLRDKLGLPTQLKNGIVSLIKDVVVCKEGDVLTPEQCKILELLDIKQAEFRFELSCVWSNGKFKKFAK